MHSFDEHLIQNIEVPLLYHFTMVNEQEAQGRFELERFNSSQIFSTTLTSMSTGSRDRTIADEITSSSSECISDSSVTNFQRNS